MLSLFSSPKVSSQHVVASITNHITTNAVPESNHSPTAAADVASADQPKEEKPTPVQSPIVEASDGNYPPPDIPPTGKLVLGVTHVDKTGVIYGQEIKQGTYDYVQQRLRIYIYVTLICQQLAYNLWYNNSWC